MAINYGLEEELYNIALEEGFQPAAAAGLVSTLGKESSYNINALNPGDGSDGSNSIGLAQWNGSRAQNLRNMFGDAPDMRQQVKFIRHEMENDVGNAGISYDEFNKISDPVEAGMMMNAKYERPARNAQGDLLGNDHIRQHAGRVYNAYANPENPYVPTRVAADTPLLSYADDAYTRAEQATEALVGVSAKQDETMRIALMGLVPGKYNQALAMLNKGEAAPPDPTPQQQPQMPARQGIAPPAASSKGLAMSSPADATANAGTPILPEGEGMPKPKRGLLDQIFPQSGEEEKDGKKWYGRDSFRDMMAGLGVGLSQMSHGEPVNIVDTMGKLRAGRANLAQQQWERGRLEKSDALQAAKYGYDIKQDQIRNARELEKLDLDRTRSARESAEWELSQNALAPMPESVLQQIDTKSPGFMRNYQVAQAGGVPLGDMNKTGLEILSKPSNNTAMMPEASDLVAQYTVKQLTPDELIERAASIQNPMAREQVKGFVDNVLKLDPKEREIRANQVLAGRANPGQPPSPNLENPVQGIQPTGGIDPRGVPQTLSDLRRQEQEDAAEVQIRTEQRKEDNKQANTIKMDLADKVTNMSEITAKLPHTVQLNEEVYNDGGRTGEVAGYMAQFAGELESLGYDGLTNWMANDLNLDSDTIRAMGKDGPSYLYGIMKSSGMSGANFSDADSKNMLRQTPDMLSTAAGRARFIGAMSADATFFSMRNKYVLDNNLTGANLNDYLKAGAVFSDDRGPIREALAFLNQTGLQGDRVDANGDVVKAKGRNGPSDAATATNAMMAYRKAMEEGGSAASFSAIEKKFGLSPKAANEALSRSVPEISMLSARYLSDSASASQLQGVKAKDGPWAGQVLTRVVNPTTYQTVWIPAKFRGAAMNDAELMDDLTNTYLNSSRVR
jgi:hypothetical protein